MNGVARQFDSQSRLSYLRTMDHVRLAGWLTAVSILLASILVLNAGCQAPSESSRTMAVSAPNAPADASTDLGIEVKGLRLSASGYMLDFRFQVTDPEKAAGLFGKGITNYVLDPETGARLIVPRPPKVGSLQQNSGIPIKNKTYFVMFANPGRFIKPGKKVVVVMGTTEIKDIMVQ